MNDLFPNNVISNSSITDSLNLNTDVKYLSNIYTHHVYPPAARLPRIVKIPLKAKVSFPIRFIRLEFDHSTVTYYSEIDTVILNGKTVPDDSIVNENNEQQATSPSTVRH